MWAFGSPGRTQIQKQKGGATITLYCRLLISLRFSFALFFVMNMVANIKSHPCATSIYSASAFTTTFPVPLASPFGAAALGPPPTNSVTPSSTTAVVAAGLTSSNARGSHDAPIIGLSVSVGILLILVIYLSLVLLCMGRRHRREITLGLRDTLPNNIHSTGTTETPARLNLETTPKAIMNDASDVEAYASSALPLEKRSAQPPVPVRVQLDAQCHSQELGTRLSSHSERTESPSLELHSVSSRAAPEGTFLASGPMNSETTPSAQKEPYPEVTLLTSGPVRSKTPPSAQKERYPEGTLLLSRRMRYEAPPSVQKEYRPEGTLLASGSMRSKTPPSTQKERYPEGTPLASEPTRSETPPSAQKGHHPEIEALTNMNKLTKNAVVQMAPTKPKPDQVLSDYNPILDEKRPQVIEEYLQKYRILFVIDDSGSMLGARWNETRDALFQIADHALNFHSEAVEIRFFNHTLHRLGVKGINEVMRSFYDVYPNGEASLSILMGYAYFLIYPDKGGTPTGHVLENILNEQISRLDIAKQHGNYTSELPLDIIVLTDGVPSKDLSASLKRAVIHSISRLDYNSPPAPVIDEAARQLRDKRHHPNWIGIQFVQIANDPAAEPTLLSLIDSREHNMVDTISYSIYKDRGGGRLTAAVLEQIILGGLHPNLRAHWNHHRLQQLQSTARVIY
ncbi:hypothetical protein D9756_008025 [Leucocoprinus leucothites]|uniref:VWFA domain-containing protein n=1 Tax=Leucocoprinus leucothites TaxID=201217 RepID=A0A8H5D4E3_9AGAR|nr:hypothetical protein D9756_008025 [Leucoagaricus leucothites]